MADIGRDLARAAALLQAGKPVAIPTETVYGLAASALDAAAITEVFHIKNRPFFDPLIVHIAAPEEAHQYAAHIPPLAERLMQVCWPGPLTLLLRKKSIDDLATAGLDTVGLRCPRHALTLELLRRIPFPLAAPSANPFGYISPTLPAHVNDQLGDRVAYILDGGASEIGVESTIVGFEEEMPVIYRQGGFSQEELEYAAGCPMATAKPSPLITTPGGLASHYAPNKPLFISDLKALISQFPHAQIGALCFSSHPPHIPAERTIVLSEAGDMKEAAQRLFASLRQLDAMHNVDIIWAERVPDRSLGKAINDRIARAAAKRTPQQGY